MAIVRTNINLSAVSYVAGEVIDIVDGATLTINATPAVRPGSIRCVTSGRCRVENLSATVPLVLTHDDQLNTQSFTGNGILEYRGAPMLLGTGTGAAQSFDFSTLFGGVIPEPTYVEVETAVGSGRFFPWLIVHEDPKFQLDTGANTTLGGAAPSSFTTTGEAARTFFWHETNRTLRTAAGFVPAGCAIRIPNIYVTNRLLTNQTRAFNIVTQGTPTGGTFTIEIRRENGTLLGTTAPIAFNAASAAVDAAIEAVTGAGTVTPAGGPLPTAVSVTWAGIYANERLGVRVASNSLTGGTNPTVTLTESSNLNLSQVLLSPSGGFDAEWVSFSNKMRFSNSSFASVRIRQVGFGANAFVASSSNGSVDIDGLSICRSPFTSVDLSEVASVFGFTSLSRIVSGGKGAAGAFSVSTLPGLARASGLRSIAYGRRTFNTQRGLRFVTLPAGVKISDVASIGAPFEFANLGNAVISDYRYADGADEVQQTANIVSAVNLLNCIGCTFASYGDAGIPAPRNYVISADAASANVVFTGGTANLQNNGIGLVSPTSNGVRTDNWTVLNMRSGPAIDLPASYLANAIQARKVFGTFATPQISGGADAAQLGRFDLLVSSIIGVTELFSGVNNYVGANYADPGTNPTTGHVTFGPIGASVGGDTSCVLSGSAYTDQIGSVFLPNTADSAVLTIPFAMHGITGFANVTPRLAIDALNAPANVALVWAPGAPTGGTFTITVATAAGAVLGTTAPIAFNATNTAVDTAIEAIPGIGAGQATVTGTSLAAAFTITFTGTLAGVPMIVTVDGGALTGGSEPGVAYAFGRARLQDGTETFGSGIVAEFGMRVPGTPWPSWSALTGANLQAAFAGLTGHQPGGAGLEMRLRLTAVGADPYRKINQVSLPTTINPALWTVGDATITLQGPEATDVTKVIRFSDNAELYSFTGAGTFEFSLGANFDAEVYFRRETAAGTVLMRSLPATQQLLYGSNGTVALFYGAQIQLAQVSAVDAINALVQSRLDVAVSTRLAAAAETGILDARDAARLAAALSA